MENNHSPPDIENQCHSLADKLHKCLSSLRSLPDDRCIYRVPTCLRRVNEKAYTPQVVSIGPLHHGRKDLRAMEQCKLRYLDNFIQRTGVELKVYIEVVRNSEEKVRDYYADSIEFPGDDFVRMILVDAVFMLETMLRLKNYEEFIYDIDEFYKQRYLFPIVIKDLQLLENQIPLFILCDIYEKATKGKLTTNFKDLCYQFLGEFLSQTYDEMRYRSADESMHLLELLWEIHVPGTYRAAPKLMKRRRVSQTLHVRTITELHKAGVRLKRSSEGTCLLDISFSKGDGVLELPIIELAFFRDNLLQNMLAYEHCHRVETYLSDYCLFLHNIVKTPNDLELLVAQGIVHHEIGDRHGEVLTLIKNLNSGFQMKFGDPYFTHLYAEIDEYCGSKRHRMRALCHEWKEILKRNYLNTPWAILSLIAATIILVLTFIQTACSLFSLENRKG